MKVLSVIIIYKRVKPKAALNHNDTEYPRSTKEFIANLEKVSQKQTPTKTKLDTHGGRLFLS